MSAKKGGRLKERRMYVSVKKKREKGRKSQKRDSRELGGVRKIKIKEDKEGETTGQIREWEQQVKQRTGKGAKVP